MFEDSNVEQMVFLVRGRAVITRRGVQVSVLFWDLMLSTPSRRYIPGALS